MYFLFSQLKRPIADWFSEKIPVKAVGIFLIIIACVFYVLWLSEIIPATIANTPPQNIIDTGLPTNPVHALDLSIILPGFAIIAVLLLRRKPIGLLLAPNALAFMILMDITIGALNIIMERRGIETSYAVTIVMAILALVSIGLLTLYLRSVKRGM